MHHESCAQRARSGDIPVAVEDNARSGAPDPHPTTAKFGDFGMAKNFDQAGLSGIPVTGNMGGTPVFIPREQVINSLVCARGKACAERHAPPVLLPATVTFWFFVG